MSKEIPWDKIDKEIRPIVRILNEEGIETFASCSGHGTKNPWVNCLISDNYGEEDIINSLVKYGLCGFSLMKVRYVVSKTQPFKDGHQFHFWSVSFWSQDCLKR